MAVKESKTSSSTNISTAYLCAYLIELKQKSMRQASIQLGVSETIAIEMLDEKKQIPLYIAIDRYQQITPQLTMWFLSENIDFFVTLFHDAIEDWQLISECIECGMSQQHVAILFNFRARNIRMTLDKSLSKQAKRKHLSMSTSLLVDTEVHNYQKGNNLIFSPREFAKFMIRISRMITLAGSEVEANIAPIIQYMSDGDYPIKIRGFKKYWLGKSEPIEFRIEELARQDKK
ncbi:hypothetical protein C9J21_18180 [Photobacterium phosphoreum]|uniref:hypothetical protein n=1 Tax=Photobacterium phosphoreum TaxID=659 RepID=UPI000D15C851|nr:hypothetical protein [Photobacterium phosphoreum]PSW30816.1 hypothetical protein C9J21_18180 [Photobacterium phosphoreum]